MPTASSKGQFTKGSLWLLQTTEGEETYRVDHIGTGNNEGFIFIHRLGQHVGLWVRPEKLTTVERLFP